MNYETPLYRPPSEAQSLILQVTIGCSHNSCTFCSMYGKKQFRVRSLEEVCEDICSARVKYGRVQRIFLADGDALAMETDALLAILKQLTASFPEAERISVYAGPKNILAKTERELAAIRQAGVKLAYFGLESGDAEVLQAVKKGVNPQEMVEAASRVRAAGIDLSLTVILGLGGKERSRLHALHTADVVSRINPEYLAALTLMVEKSTPLAAKIVGGEFLLLSPHEVLLELKMILANLDVKHCLFRSNHASNYFAIGGLLPQDKGRLLAETERALGHTELLKNEYLRGL
ncbi:MAG: radical SAM protein [Dethiobacter sp.]|nr:radical SAM protein [Dethiobacter sp.]MBS3898732.1 radical SAM protein [Dethiobacter sp.]MBS3983735.1 radical SAM protein [Dethiobacter sp.]MCL4463512.1 radical SAM protein [Bacillota bacterium]